jgi:N-methylhydantoinase B/oxoprolinase/acetone carboxylase alpha subunit
MQKRNGDLIITRSEANTPGTWALQQEREGDNSRGFSEGEVRHVEACKQSRLSMVVVESPELGVEQGSAGRGGVRGEGVGRSLRRKLAVAAMISNQQRVWVSTGVSGGRTSKPRRMASRQRKSV